MSIIVFCRCENSKKSDFIVLEGNSFHRTLNEVMLKCTKCNMTTPNIPRERAIKAGIKCIKEKG